MENITLEKVDQVIERTSVTYGVAKEALEKTDGNVLDAIILIEEMQSSQIEEVKEDDSNNYETMDELKKWLIDTVKKGNVSRIRIKKDDKVLADIPVNAGIAAGAIAIMLPPVLAVVVVATVATNLVIEITRPDGRVEVVNKVVKSAASNLKEKTFNVASGISNKVKDRSESKTGVIIKEGIFKNIKKPTIKKDHKVNDEKEITNFTYTVNFEEIE
ncbi:DUF4342 domain-containing protein [Clostridium massiliamazoniense]|uniref:DUF4342 domain-containing protein n=1 Tax=Clostridium massiliamazoniense TaxID=1347366 RepID=UPI0006D79580|nr:DUF4342 domain-containing protein [Clostridium massiliamazoniense]